jgi:hypothetical protein
VTTVGIDFDTRAVHLVRLGEDGAATYTRCELTGHDAFERLRSVRGAMPRSSFWDDVVAVAIEEPQGAQKATVAKLKAVQGAIVSCIPRATLVEPMVPARWRTGVGLPGNASKSAVQGFAMHHLLGNPPDTHRSMFRKAIAEWGQDACDAYCLALAVSRLVESEAA